jgi:hypothetical protein
VDPKLMISKQPATHSANTAEPWQLAIRDERAVRELVGSVTDALAIAPTSWVPSFLGLPSSWGPAPYSEYQLLWSGDVPRLARYLVDVGIPSVPGRAPGWVPGPLASLFWHPSHVDRHPDENGRSDSHPHEAWFFINGILHDDALAQMNGDYLAYLFHRPITLLQNSTDGALVDLLECAVERLGATAEDVDAAFPPLMNALKDAEKERVVVIAHSQGTLIVAVVLELIKHIYARTSSNRLSDADVDAIHRRTRADGMRFDRRHIKPLNARELGRLELYCFANCASHMRYIDAVDGAAFPWIESFANQHDIVARLGVVAPHPGQRQIEIDGPRYEHRGAWGHLLNAHYLRAIEQAQLRERVGRAAAHDGAPYTLINRPRFPGAVVPRLYDYLAGGSRIPKLGRPDRVREAHRHGDPSLRAR